MTASNRKNLILWRHAQAQEIQFAKDDVSRALTKNGKNQALVMANWLKPYLANNTYIISSPALRTEQTVKALNLPYHLHNSLLPEASVDEVLQLIQDFYQSNISDLLLVGHQPWLGQVAAYFLQIKTAEIGIKKAGVWWLTQSLKQAKKVDAEDSDEKFKLIAVQTPQFVLQK